MTVSRTLELRVGDCRKSTRQRYSPSSRSSTLFRDRVAGSVTVRKYPRSSRISLSFQCDGTSECFPRTSKLWKNDSVKITSAVFCLFSRTEQITTFDYALWETCSVSYGCAALNAVISLLQWKLFAIYSTQFCQQSDVSTCPSNVNNSQYSPLFISLE